MFTSRRRRCRFLQMIEDNGNKSSEDLELGDALARAPHGRCFCLKTSSIAIDGRPGCSWNSRSARFMNLTCEMLITQIESQCTKYRGGGK